MKSLVRSFVPIRKLNSAYYHYRRNRWRWDPRFRDEPSIRIDRPVYLIGTQGGGLTLLSRILHRHPHAVSVTGDHRYWAGDDETQNVLGQILPEALGWRQISVTGYNSDDHNWLYANDAFLPYYRDDGRDATRDLSEQYRSVLRRIINLNGRASEGNPPRFIDKSQSLTVRVGLVRKLLCDYSPKFVLITRNPFALAWRAVTRDAVISGLECSDERKFEVAIQHWRNSLDAALADGGADLRWWRFEDLLCEPQRVVQEICAHVELQWDPAILPGPHDVFPWGSAYDAFSRRKWYPLRPDVSSEYLRAIPAWAVDYLQQRCPDLIERFGYSFDAVT